MTRLLVAEDDDHLRRLFRVLLTAQGYEVAEARDGREGLKEALASPPDLIVTDGWMPEMDGVEMLRAMRARGVGAPALFVTAVAEMPAPEVQRELGIVQTLAKPFQFDALLATVKSWADRP